MYLFVVFLPGLQLGASAGDIFFLVIILLYINFVQSYYTNNLGWISSDRFEVVLHFFPKYSNGSTVLHICWQAVPQTCHSI